MAKKSEYEKGFRDGQKSLRVRFSGPEVPDGTFISGVGGQYSYTLPASLDFTIFGKRVTFDETFVWKAIIEEHCE